MESWRIHNLKVRNTCFIPMWSYIITICVPLGRQKKKDVYCAFCVFSSFQVSVDYFKDSSSVTYPIEKYHQNPGLYSNIFINMVSGSDGYVITTTYRSSTDCLLKWKFLRRIGLHLFHKSKYYNHIFVHWLCIVHWIDLIFSWTQVYSNNLTVL